MHLFPPRFFSLLSLSSHVFSAVYLPPSRPAPLLLRWWWSKGWPCQSICQRLTVLQHMHYTDGYHPSRNDCPPCRHTHTLWNQKREREGRRGLKKQTWRQMSCCVARWEDIMYLGIVCETVESFFLLFFFASTFLRGFELRGRFSPPCCWDGIAVVCFFPLAREVFVPLCRQI